jgi:hypothetical protein
MIDLKPLTPVAAGHLRLVYDHPAQRDCLIKVMRPEMVAKRWGGARRWYKRIPRAQQYTGFVRELKEYVGIHARFPDGKPPIARTLGVVETDHGMGLIVERVRGPDEKPGPTLEALVKRHAGVPPWLEQALVEFFADLERYNVIVGDMHPGNLVYGEDSRGGPRLVLIDGFGEKNFIPRCTLSRAVNRWNTRRWVERLRRKMARLF